MNIEVPIIIRYTYSRGHQHESLLLMLLKYIHISNKQDILYIFLSTEHINMCFIFGWFVVTLHTNVLLILLSANTVLVFVYKYILGQPPKAHSVCITIMMSGQHSSAYSPISIYADHIWIGALRTNNIYVLNTNIFQNRQAQYLARMFH